MWVNGIAVDGPDHWPWNTSGRALWLEAGKPYSLKLDGYHHPTQEGKGLSLQWSEPETNGTYTLIPTSQLSPEPPKTAVAKTPAKAAKN